jgi:hypothetical protein
MKAILLSSLHAEIGMEVTGLQLLKLVSPRLDTQTDTTRHVHECCNQHDRKVCPDSGNGANRAGRHQFYVAEYAVLPGFGFIGTFFRHM